MMRTQEYKLHPLVQDILDLLLNVPDVPGVLCEQVKHLREREHTPTGIGYYVYFDHAPAELRSDFGSPWDSVELRCEGLEDHALVMLHQKDGLIDNLEIWSVSGGFPDQLPTSYQLRQIWLGSPGRWIEVKSGFRTTGKAVGNN